MTTLKRAASLAEDYSLVHKPKVRNNFNPKSNYNPENSKFKRGQKGVVNNSGLNVVAGQTADADSTNSYQSAKFRSSKNVVFCLSEKGSYCIELSSKKAQDGW